MWPLVKYSIFLAGNVQLTPGRRRRFLILLSIFAFLTVFGQLFHFSHGFPLLCLLLSLFMGFIFFYLLFFLLLHTRLTSLLYHILQMYPSQLSWLLFNSAQNNSVLTIPSNFISTVPGSCRLVLLANSATRLILYTCYFVVHSISFIFSTV